MENPKISVVIPVYNAQPYLQKAVDSVLGQTHANIEVILVDDGSTDASGQMCDEYAAQDSRVVVIHQDNAGLPAARNAGMRGMTGDWVAFVDADDWIEPDSFARCLPFLRQGIQVVNYAFVTEYETGPAPRALAQKHIDFTGGDMRKSLLLGTIDECTRDGIDYDTAMLGAAWIRLVDTTFLHREDIWFVPGIRRCEDLLFSIEVFQKADTVIYSNDILYHYFQQQQSMVHKFNPRTADNILGYFAVLEDLLQQELQEEEYRQALEYRAVRSLFEALRQGVFNRSNPAKWREKMAEANRICGQPLFRRAVENYYRRPGLQEYMHSIRILCIRRRWWRLYVPINWFCGHAVVLWRKIKG